MIHVGTSGYSYDDWRGRWYPPDLPKARMFDYYVERFDAVEINSSFYRVPSRKTIDSLIRRSCGRVRLCLKLYRGITHDGDCSAETVSSFIRCIEPLASEDVLGALLIQFPFRFHFLADNRDYLKRVWSAFDPFARVVEIRHASWQSPEAKRFLKDESVNLCITDMPRLRNLPLTDFGTTGPATEQANAPVAYIRFHGRNARKWFGSDNSADPYDYLYSSEELAAWVEPIRELDKKAETTFVFFNNHLNAQAPANAAMMSGLLGLTPVPPAHEDLFPGL